MAPVTKRGHSDGMKSHCLIALVGALAVADAACAAWPRTHPQHRAWFCGAAGTGEPSPAYSRALRREILRLEAAGWRGQRLWRQLQVQAGCGKLPPWTSTP
jgi:hypothetical protein